eukprot:6451468-Amphidinium_carterae.1
MAGNNVSQECFTMELFGQDISRNPSSLLKSKIPISLWMSHGWIMSLLQMFQSLCPVHSDSCSKLWYLVTLSQADHHNPVSTSSRSCSTSIEMCFFVLVRILSVQCLEVPISGCV